MYWARKRVHQDDRSRVKRLEAVLMVSVAVVMVASTTNMSKCRLFLLLEREYETTRDHVDRLQKAESDDDDDGNGISRRSQVMMRQAPHRKRKNFLLTLQHGPLSTRRELQSHPLARQAQDCGRLTRPMERGPDGTCRDHWRSFSSVLRLQT